MFTWHKKIWDQLVSSASQQRMAHALLLHGPAGVGKLRFAVEYAKYMLCEQPVSSQACGRCKSCSLSLSESGNTAHPDLHIIQPEEPGKAIKVDQIRALISGLTLTRHTEGYRVVVISPAESLNVSASNSLLKTLEEPPVNTLIILISNQVSQLLATIRSRTQMIHFPLPGTTDSLSWLRNEGMSNPELCLKLAGGAPLTAQQFGDSDTISSRNSHFSDWQDVAHGKADAIEIAAKWSKQGLNSASSMPISWVYGWILDMLRILQGASTDQLSNNDFSEILHNLAIQVDLDSLYKLVDRVNESIRMMDSSANQQMLLEGILLNWAGLKRK